MHIRGAGITSSSGAVEGAALIRLLTWLSPAFPIGAFSYSHGLETAIVEGICHDCDSTGCWIKDLLVWGGGWSDAVLLSHSWQAGSDRIENLLELNDLALALAPSRERFLETTQQGMAFLKACHAWPTPLLDKLQKANVAQVALPVILGATAREHGIALQAIQLGALHAFSSNLISVAMRLIPLGQSDGLALQSTLESVIVRVAEKAAQTPLDELGGCCFQSDIMAMQHETLRTRIFRS